MQNLWSKYGLNSFRPYLNGYSSLSSGPPLNFTKTETIPARIGGGIPSFHRPLLTPPLNQSDDYNNATATWGEYEFIVEI